MMNMRTRYFLVLVVAVAFAATGCAVDTGPAVEIMMDPDAPVTESPGNYGVGTTRTWDHTLNGNAVRVTSTLTEKRDYEGRQVYVHSDSLSYRDPGFPCDGANGFMFDEANDGYVACLKDGEVLSSTTPYYGRYDWPLEVGKSWRTEYVFTDNVIHPDWSGPGWQEMTVVAWEEVTVPAGTFMAYKVVRTKGNWETAGEDIQIEWYSPEIPSIVKSIWHRSTNDGYGGAEHMTELASYDLK